jgi:N-acyl-D-aspartate/D-glutamate deacylase
VEFVVKRLAADNAQALGLRDRGTLAVGLRADINVVDFDKLAIERPNMRYDLPAGGKRLVQGARGYRATLCAGEIVHEHGTATGALPGRLIRGGKA